MKNWKQQTIFSNDLTDHLDRVGLEMMQTETSPTGKLTLKSQQFLRFDVKKAESYFGELKQKPILRKALYELDVLNDFEAERHLSQGINVKVNFFVDTQKVELRFVLERQQDTGKMEHHRSLLEVAEIFGFRQEAKKIRLKQTFTPVVKEELEQLHEKIFEKEEKNETVIKEELRLILHQAAQEAKSQIQEYNNRKKFY